MTCFKTKTGQSLSGKSMFPLTVCSVRILPWISRQRILLRSVSLQNAGRGYCGDMISVRMGEDWDIKKDETKHGKT